MRHLRVELAAIRGMLLLAEAPEHVLYPVRRIKQTEEEAFIESSQFVEHHPLAFA
jgi:hypothetical protein